MSARSGASESCSESRNRSLALVVLCSRFPVHQQSAASFRAQLGQITNALPGNWQFHFLDAPHLSLVDTTASADSDAWARAAGLRSLIRSLPPNHQRTKAALQELSSDALSAADKAITETYEIGGIDEVESLVGRKSGKSCERCWSYQFAPRCEGGSELTVGLESTLALVGDYMREHGPVSLSQHNSRLISCPSHTSRYLARSSGVPV